MLEIILAIEGITADTGTRRRIEIDQTTGLILKVGEPTGLAGIVLKDEIIFPGFIDLHVHAREDMSHTQDYKEDFTTAGEAAINGGVVAFAEMPNNPIPPVDDMSYEIKNNLAKKSPVEILLYAGIGSHTKPLTKTVPYKVFMGPSIGDLFFSSRTGLETAMENYKGQAVSFHCEDPDILNKNKNELTHQKQRPEEAEISALDFALMLIEKYNLSGKICHISTVESMKKIIEAKKRGLSVTVEVAPHHLYFDDKKVAGKGKRLQVNPPIRSTRENRFALIALLKNGDIDYLATDHAPHTLEEKEKGISGLTHLDTYGSVVSWLMREHHLTSQEIMRVCSTNPANFFNKFFGKENLDQHRGYGKIEKGYIGSLTVLNINKPIKIKREMLKTKCRWSPFEGVVFPGQVAMTIIKGKILKNEIK